MQQPNSTSTVPVRILALLARLRVLSINILRVWIVGPNLLDFDTNGTGQEAAVRLTDDERQALRDFLPDRSMTQLLYRADVWCVQTVGPAWDDGDRASHDSSRPGPIFPLWAYAKQEAATKGYEVRSYPTMEAFNASGFVREATGVPTFEEAFALAQRLRDEHNLITKIVGQGVELSSLPAVMPHINNSMAEERAPAVSVRLISCGQDVWIVLNGVVAADLYIDQIPHRGKKRAALYHYASLFTVLGYAVDVRAVDLTGAITGLGEMICPGFSSQGGAITERDVLDYLLAHHASIALGDQDFEAEYIAIPTMDEFGNLTRPA